jgi:hypothetical protein
MAALTELLHGGEELSDYWDAMVHSEDGQHCLRELGLPAQVRARRACGAARVPLGEARRGAASRQTGRPRRLTPAAAPAMQSTDAARGPGALLVHQVVLLQRSSGTAWGGVEGMQETARGKEVRGAARLRPAAESSGRAAVMPARVWAQGC